MRYIVRWLVAIAVVVGIGGLIYATTRPEPVQVVTASVERGAVEQTVANTRAGTVKACRRARLSPSIGGQIARLPIVEGDHVEAGDLLLEIWNEDLRAQLVLASRDVGVAQAQEAGSCASAEEAQRQATRARQLFASRVGSLEATDRAETQARALHAQCEAAKARVTMAQAQVEVARANLARTRLLAPFDGVVAKIEGELSEYVTPSPVGVQTPPAVDLIEDSCYYVSAPIDEVDAAGVRVGMEVRITLDAFRNQHFSGTVRRIAPYVVDLEKQARTVDIETVFAEGTDLSRFLAGYSADVEILLDSREATLHIPTESVVDSNTVYLFLAERQQVVRQEITTGLANWSRTEVLAGLTEGDLLVVNTDVPGRVDCGDAVVA